MAVGGLMSGSSKHPRLHREAQKAECVWDAEVAQRIVGDIPSNMEDWLGETGGDRTKAKNHKNCVRPPPVHPEDKDMKMLSVRSPSPLDPKPAPNHIS